MLLKPEISVGDILTIISIAVSVTALLISWQRSQELKRKEFADKIRRGSSTVVVKIQRWRELALRFFEDIQPLITEADMELVKKQNVNDVRDVFWLKISDVRTMTSQRMVDEQVETAYIDLFGFDPRIQTLFTEVINRLKAIDNSIYTQTRYSTQADILSFLPQSTKITSTELGNKLRNTCYLLGNECQRLMDETIEPFTKEMVRLIEQSDRLIVKRRFKISSTADLYSISLDQLQKKMDEQVNLKLLHVAAMSVSHDRLNILEDLGTRFNQPTGYSIASFMPADASDRLKTMGVISLDLPHHDKVSKEVKKEVATFADMAAKEVSQAKNKNIPGKQTLTSLSQKASSKTRRKKRRKQP